VDLTAEGYPKPTGVFFNTPNYAYKFKNVLNPNYIYRIKIINPTGELDSSDAPVIVDNDSNVFNVTVLDNPSINRAGLDFSNSSINKFFDIQGTYATVSNFNFEGQQNGPAYVAQAVITFNWADSDMTSHIKTPRSYDYNLGFQVMTGGSQFDYEVDHLDLYSAVAAGMTPTPANTLRLMGRCGIAVYLSTYDYYLYQQNSLTQGTGLTGSDIQPVATNIKGANALGLFTAKAERSGLVTITINTIDSLRSNPLTAGARIVGTNY
jgi:hypothetical protein